MLGVVELMLQTGINFLPALVIDEGLGLIPDEDEILHFLHTTVIVECHFLKDGATTLKTVGPRYTVEPEEITLRTGVDVIVELTIGLAILGSGVRAGMCAVEADRVLVGLVIVHGAPLVRYMRVVTIRLWTVMFVEGEDVMQSDGHHVVDASLTRAQHDAEEA